MNKKCFSHYLAVSKCS